MSEGQAERPDRVLTVAERLAPPTRTNVPGPSQAKPWLSNACDAARSASLVTETIGDGEPARNLAQSAEPRSTAIRDWQLKEEARYRVHGEHARGGIGRVLRAHDFELDRPVALKELLIRDDQAEARFIREALITARLQHPAIVPVYEAGRWANGKPYYAMKMISGRSLAELIREKDTLNERLALLPHVIAVADAMAYAHGQGIIHRDLKPSNVLIGAFGETMVVDWGLAADLTRADRNEGGDGLYENAVVRLTAAGTVLGTPQYMPIEQAQGKVVDARADVYAIGAILYQAVAGAPPYEGKTSKEILAKIAKEDPVSLKARAPGVPQDLVTIVTKAMSRDANARYPTAKELTEDLRRFQAGQLVSAHLYSRPMLFARWLRRHKVPVALSAAFLLLLGAVMVVGLRRILRERDHAECQRLVAE